MGGPCAAACSPSARVVLAALVAAPLVVAGCSQTDSADVRTSGITAAITVAVDADGVTVSARLTVGTLDTVDLSGGDQLVATVAGRRRVLGHDDSLSQDAYGTRFDGRARAGSTVTVALRRGSGDESAPVSTVRLPAEVRIAAPSAGSTQRRSHDLVVAANDGGGRLSVGWRGSCVVSDLSDTQTGDSVVVAAGAMIAATSASSSPGTARAPRDCAVALTMTRTTTGELDDHYKGGSIRATRTDAVAIRSVP